MGFIDRVQGSFGLKKEMSPMDNMEEVEKAMDAEKFLLGVPDVQEIKTINQLYAVANSFDNAYNDFKLVKGQDRITAGEIMYKRLQKAIYESKHWENEKVVVDMKFRLRLLSRYKGN